MTEQVQESKPTVKEPAFEEKLDNAMMDKMAGDSSSLDRLVKEHFDTINNLEVKGIITRDQAHIFTKFVVCGAAWYSKVLIMIVHTHLLISGSIEGKVRQQGVDLGNAAALEKYMKAKQDQDLKF